MAPTKTAEEAISSPAEGGEVRNPNDVFWDGGQDPSNPKNWSAVRRWCHIVVVSLLTFVTSMGSSMLAPAVPDVMKSLHSDNAELQSFVVSIYVIGFVVGPLVVAPLSELFGRAIVYHVSNVVFLGATIGCALSTNVGMFLAFRLLCGCAGAAPLALGGGSISDIMEPERMGTAMAVWGLGSLVPPVFSPIAGGYLSEDIGWRWIFWVIAIPMGILTIMSLFVLQETYAPVLLAHKAKRLRKETGNLELRSRLDQQQLSQQEVVIGTLVRPLRILLTSPIVMLLAIDVAIVYGYQYLVFTTLSYIFQDQYHLSTGLSGLVYLGNGIGTILGIFIIGHASDKVTEHRKKKASDPDEPLPPEGWLWPMLPAGMLVPAGLFWYGWSLQSNAFVVVPLVGLGVFGFGMMGIFQPVQIYVVNAFGKHAASAMAATAVLRSLVGALLPLGGQRMYDALGMGWGNSLLAFIALGLMPVPFLLMKYGARLRQWDSNLR
ncbi:MFS general substrate transporter [Aspergillus pseudonomiae]|uniref:MFS general substrate transporter n=1 Tax=Aspergillus pseudonomiae TaxID=1506151 RepID=A0A5N6HUP4_9EURO|nr:MFS general substrate transporter [Aspergillus pseudonomiae]KAB8257988.1 MFS general substrate transporter [Aspergillus pseudonomiae]KAE8397767.1 MFS general substrate transporter [Aspergillus pseudonomiae]